MTGIQVLPFKLSSEQAEKSLLRYLAKHPYLPVEFIKTRLERRSFYAPAYKYHYKWDVNWAAQFGNERIEHFTTWSHHHHLHHTKQPEPHNQFRIVTDWHPCSGRDAGEKVFVAYAGDKLPPQGADLVNLADGSDAITIDCDKIVTDVEPYAVTADELWKKSVQYRGKVAVDLSIMKFAQGDKQRNWHWSGHTDYTVSALLCPVEAFGVKYQGDWYFMWLNANENTVTNDLLPVDVKNILYAHQVFLLPLLSALIGYFFVASFKSFLIAAAITLVMAAVAFIWKLVAEEELREGLRSAAGLKEKSQENFGRDMVGSSRA